MIFHSYLPKGASLLVHFIQSGHAAAKLFISRAAGSNLAPSGQRHGPRSRCLPSPGPAGGPGPFPQHYRPPSTNARDGASQADAECRGFFCVSEKSCRGVEGDKGLWRSRYMCGGGCPDVHSECYEMQSPPASLHAGTNGYLLYKSHSMFASTSPALTACKTQMARLRTKLLYCHRHTRGKERHGTSLVQYS